jgi:hypothetical protein
LGRDLEELDSEIGARDSRNERRVTSHEPGANKPSFHSNYYYVTHYLQDCHSEAQPKNLRRNDLTKSNQRDSSLCSE